MKVESIEIFSEVENIFDASTDVWVKLENGHTYIVVVETPKYLLGLMDYEKNDFLSLSDPIIVVRKLTKEVVEKAIEAYAEDEAYYLKLYDAHLDVKTLNVLKDREIARDQFIDDLLEKGESIDIENYDLIDFNTNNDSNNNLNQKLFSKYKY
jgi:hypothetical protein